MNKDEDSLKREPEPSKDESVSHTGFWVVRGRVTDCHSRGISGLTVRLYDKRHLYDEKLGTTVTDEDGYYMISYPTEEISQLMKEGPAIYLKVLNREGKTLYSSRRRVRAETGYEDTFDIRIRRKVKRNR